MYINKDFLQFEYHEDTERTYDLTRYLNEEGSEPFDAHSQKQMLIMLNSIANQLSLDEYGLKRLEVMLRTDLPFFAINRRLVFKWVCENFLF